MAASAPAPYIPNWIGDGESSASNQDIHNSTGLEVVMAGMNLVSSLPPPPGRKITSSTVSSSPPENQEDDGPQHPGFIVKGPNSDSPSIVERKTFTMTSKSQSRPPGLAGAALPSPISKPGHSKDSSATSPLLTLTPNSSVDGTSEWLSMTRQASPFHASEGPSLPFLNTSADGRRSQVDVVSSNLSNLDLTDDENDGLLGLDALHERANTSPGQFLHSSSPPISSRGYYATQISSQQSEFERPRSSRDRPPLSQSYGEAPFGNSERSTGAFNNPFSISSNRSIGEASNISMESSDSRGFGAIGRPELRQEPNRRRSSSQDNLKNPLLHQQQGIPDQFTNKFRTQPTLSSQLHQQQKGLFDNYNDVQKIRHVRSVSQPGLPNVSGASQYFQPGMDSHFFTQQGHSYSEHSSFKPTRSASVSHVPPQVYDGVNYGKNATSLLASNINGGVGGYGAYQSYSASQRRDVFDYQSGSASSSMLDDMHSYVSNSTSLALSARQIQYGGHIRQASDGAVMSMGMSNIHGPSSHFSFHTNVDDDFAHPLAGEHIDFPDHDDPSSQDLAEPYFVSQAGSHPLLRAATHTHSMSLDAIPSQYMDPSLHRSATGSPLPVPKVVYAVKFKRSQRNFVLGPRIARDLKIGTYVKVEADRGEDLGIVVGKVAADKYSFSTRSSFTAGMGPPPAIGAGASDLKRIIRLATHDEVSLLSLKREEEEELLKICRRKVRERCLPMNVVDAEYQFDRHKLTFFFEAEGRVDFRELVRDLFSMYKTRIWMQQLDKNTATSAQAIIAPQTANLQMDYGTPIIAPPSEFADSIILNGLAGFDSRP